MYLLEYFLLLIAKNVAPLGECGLLRIERSDFAICWVEVVGACSAHPFGVGDEEFKETVVMMLFHLDRQRPTLLCQGWRWGFD